MELTLTDEYQVKFFRWLVTVISLDNYHDYFHRLTYAQVGWHSRYFLLDLQFFRITNVINRFVNLRIKNYWLLLSSIRPKFEQHLAIYTFPLFNNDPAFKQKIGWGTSTSVVCSRMPNITDLVYIRQVAKVVLPLVQNTLESPIGSPFSSQTKLILGR
jgi:hypothetical protein